MTVPQEEILDYKLQHWLHHQIDLLPVNQQIQLKSIRRCCTKPIPVKGEKSAVYLMKSDSHAFLFGQMTCKNTWACPICTARMMAKYRSEIASMLDMLRDKKFTNHDYIAIGLTFTVPHLAFMRCKETTDILYNTWRYFTMKNSKKSNSHVYTSFANAVNVKYHIRVAEYTYGENGWHPHFHAIFWIDRAHADEVLQWQNQLNEFWTQCAKSYTLKYWLQNDLHSNINADRSALCDKLFAKSSNKYPALKISTDKNGNLLECLSSDYITGWGSDRELTGNIRKEASHDGHFTVYQIMQMAQYDDKYKDIFMDYLLNVTRKPVHARVRRTPGMIKLLQQYRNINGFKQVIKQKKTTGAKILLYFDDFQWSSICTKNRHAPVISNILYLASVDIELLFDYLDFLEIECFLPDKTLSPFLQAIENIFADTSAAG